MRVHRRWLVLLAGAAIVAGCAGSPTAVPVPTGVQASTQPVPSASPSAAPAPSASLPPASASISFGSTIAGMAQGILVSCESPTLTGLSIDLFGATTDKDVYTSIKIRPDSVAVSIDAGSGSTFTGRSFRGSGVIGFDPTKGAQVDSPLAEFSSGAKPGSLPVISSIKGTVDCGNQRPGSSTLTISGSVPDGALSGPIDPIRVDCNPHAAPATVHAIGVMKLGSTSVIVIFQATAAGYSLFVVPGATTKEHFYLTKDPAAAAISPTGAHVSGSASESGTSNSVQLSGDLVCGVVNP